MDCRRQLSVTIASVVAACLWMHGRAILFCAFISPENDSSLVVKGRQVHLRGVKECIVEICILLKLHGRMDAASCRDAFATSWPDWTMAEIWQGLAWFADICMHLLQSGLSTVSR